MNITSGWQKRTFSDIAYTLDSDTEKGLSSNKVLINRHKWGKNDLWYTGSLFMFFKPENGFSLLGFVLMAIAAFSAFAFGKCNDAVAVGIVLLAGILLYSVLYMMLGFLCMKNSRKWIPYCTVIRDGKPKMIRATELVLGDIVLLKEGDRVCADIKLISSHEMTVTDPPFTKRKGPIGKCAAGVDLVSGNESVVEDFIYAGSTVCSGNGKGIVCATGSGTAQGKKGMIRLASSNLPERFVSSRKKSVFYGAVAMMFSFIAIAVGVFSPLSAYDFIGTFLVFLAFAVSAGGEILPSASCLAYYVSIKKSMTNGLVLRDTAGVDYIMNCDGMIVENTSIMKSDKTKLCAMWTPGGEITLGDSSGDELISMMLTGTAYGKGKYGSEIILAASEQLKGRMDPAKYLITTQNNKPILEHKIFGSTHYSLFVSGIDQYFAITGSIEEVISKCTKIRKSGSDHPMSKEDMAHVLKNASDCLKTASSIIAVAVRKSPYNSLKRLSVLTSELTFIGFVAMDTPAVSDLPSDLAYLRQKKVPFVFFTDGSGEDINFARKLGIIKGREYLTDGKDPAAAIASVLAENSLGGAVYAENEDVLSECLMDARKKGKRVVFVGGQEHIKNTSYSVCYDAPLQGSAAFIKNGDVSSVIKTFRSSRKVFSRLNKTYIYLFVSAVVRAAYSLIAIFGVPYVYPSVILGWGLLLDLIIAGAIVSAEKKDK